MNEQYWLAADIGGEQYSALTDGHWLILQRGVPPEVTIRDNVNLAPVAGDILATPVTLADEALLGGLRVAPLASCETCEGKGILTCDECEGNGDVECCCTCGDEHEADCEACAGEGEVDCDCVPHGPVGRSVPARIAGLDGTWDRRLLTPLIDALGVPLLLGVKDEMLVLHGREKWAALMGLHLGDNGALPPLHVIGIERAVAK